MKKENIVVKMQFGSHIYGTNLPESDFDVKCIVIPDAKDIILQRAINSTTSTTKENKNDKNTASDIDTETFSLQKYFKLLLQGQTVAIDMLFAPEKFYLENPSELWLYIVKNRHQFLHSDVSSYAGYCRQQANKYGIKGSRVSAVRVVVEFLTELGDRVGKDKKLVDYWDEVKLITQNNEFISIVDKQQPDDLIVEHLECCNRLAPKFITIKEALAIYQRVLMAYGDRAKQAETNQGVDWKALMHAVRVCEEAKELLLTGHVTFPRPEAELLLKIRKGELPYKEVAEYIEWGLDELTVAQKESNLPKKPNHELAEKIVLQAYLEKIIDFNGKRH